MVLHVRGVRPVVGGALGRRHGRVVGQRRVVEIGVGDVEAEAVDTALQPELQHVERGTFAAGSVQLSLGCWRRNLWW